MSDPTQTRLAGLAAGRLRRLLAGLVPPRPTANRPLVAGMIATAVAYVVLQVVFCIHVHVSFEGEYAATFLPSKFFGVPAREAAAGLRPVGPHPWHGHFGWDSQFYYYVSNDLGMTRDAKDVIGRYGLDSPSYRYQRVGLPLLAHGASRLLGYKLTNPFVYHAVQLFVTAVGFGGLVFWLTYHRLSWAWALAWLLAGGTTVTLRYGMPDPCCDAFLVLAFLGAYFRRLWLYVPAATLMCLGRETYVVVPFCLWVATVVNARDWPGVRAWWLRVALTAVPGAVVLGWAAFISRRLGEPLLHGLRRDQGAGLTDYPFRAGVETVSRMWQTGSVADAEYAAAAVLTLAVVLGAGLAVGRRVLVVGCVVPFVGLLTLAGPIVWHDHSGFLKNVLPAVAFGVLLLGFTRHWAVRGVLLLQLAVGVDAFVRDNLFLSPQLSADMTAVDTSLMDIDPRPPVPPAWRVTDYRLRASATVVSTQDDPPYHGVWRWCHRQPTKVRVRFDNTSSQVWPALPRLVDHSLYVGCIIRDTDGKVVSDTLYKLPTDIPPGGSFEQLYPLKYARLDGQFTAQFSLYQHTDGWFVGHNADSQVTIPVEFHSRLR